MDPFDEIKRIQKLMNRMLFGPFSTDEEWYPRPMKAGGEFVREPLIDIRQEKGKLTVTAEVPGVEKKDIKLKINDDEFGNQRLVISAKREEKKEKKEKTGSFMSQRSLVFVKEVPLPARVKKKDSEAVYRNGILEVTFTVAEPKKEDKVDIPIK